jgi:hypothetical protein
MIQTLCAPWAGQKPAQAAGSYARSDGSEDMSGRAPATASLHGSGGSLDQGRKARPRWVSRPVWTGANTHPRQVSQPGFRIRVYYPGARSPRLYP